MKYKELVAYFGGLTKAAQALGLARQSVHAWGLPGRRVPPRYQLKAAALSKRRLKPDESAKKVAEDLAPYFNGGRRAHRPE